MPQRILVLGDSLSAGYGMAREQAWPALLNERLATQKPDWRVVNLSISGDTTASGVNRLPLALEKYSPVIILIELGANDGLRGLSADAMQENLHRMIEQAQQAGAWVLLVGMQLPVNYGPAYTKDFHDRYDRLAEGHAIAYLPFLLNGIARDQDWFQPDGLHPTAAAQPAILDNVWQVLLPLLHQAAG